MQMRLDFLDIGTGDACELDVCGWINFQCVLCESSKYDDDCKENDICDEDKKLSKNGAKKLNKSMRGQDGDVLNEKLQRLNSAGSLQLPDDRCKNPKISIDISRKAFWGWIQGISTRRRINDFIYRKPKDFDESVYGGEWRRLQAESQKKESEKRAPNHNEMQRIFSVYMAPHHLIPGNGSMKNSNLNKKWLTAPEGKIGYNINSWHNGVWLPTSYDLKNLWNQEPFIKYDPSVRPYRDVVKKGKVTQVTAPAVKGFINPDPIDEFRDEFAWRAITVSGAQFHDRHPYYEIFVTKALNMLSLRLDILNGSYGVFGMCPQISLHASADRGLVFSCIIRRLHELSSRMRKLVDHPAINWKDNIFTSDFTRAYMEAEHRKRNKKCTTSLLK